jgi:NAD(P)-dependent dehydrogenase (short-subunit alcohol dehydrogenase family)
MKHALVTGVSSGIGRAAAAELLQHGFAVFGSVRNNADAERLASELGPNFTPLLFDVTREDQVREAAERVDDAAGAQGLCGLVNNAGISRPGPLSELSASAVREHLEINVMGVFNVTKAFLPSLRMGPGRTQPPGRIVNISSVSGRIAYPFMGPYAASKHALEALSDSWRRELMLYGVDVIVIEPGAIQTQIWDKAATISSEFSDSDYGPILKHIDLMESKRGALPAEIVARVIYRALTCRRPRSRYAIPDRWWRYWILPRILPDRWLDAVIARALGMEKKRDA